MVTQPSLLRSKTGLGVVIPTLGNRPDMMNVCLRSALDCGADFVVIVSKLGDAELGTYEKLPHQQVIQLKQSIIAGAASAINEGFEFLRANTACYLATWIGDDDQLIPDGISGSLTILEQNPGTVAVVGTCRVIDSDGYGILEVRPRWWDVAAFEVKGNKLPQPGSIFRMSALEAVGFLDNALKYAFDQDLFHKLKTQGKFALNHKPVALFRWHAGSLTGANQIESVREAISVRVAHGTKAQSLIAKCHGRMALAVTALNLTRLQGKIGKRNQRRRGE